MGRLTAVDVLLIRQGMGLVAADLIGHESLSAMTQNEQVVATIRRARNPRHHRNLFLLLNEVYKNQDFYATIEGMLDDIKIAVGHCRREPSKSRLAVTSVLRNFLVIDRLNLFKALTSHQFFVTNHVREEITAEYDEQVRRLDASITEGFFQEIIVADLPEVQMFAKLTKTGLGEGECSAAAVAINRGHTLAIDDKRAIKILGTLTSASGLRTSLVHVIL